MTKSQIIATINDFFESLEDAEIWWEKFNPVFEDKPRNLLTTEIGCDRLKNMIYQIETGAFK